MTSRAPPSLEDAVNAQLKFRQWMRKNYLRRLEVKYKETSNPILQWQAIKYCLDYNYALPTWVRNYLLESSYNLLEREIATSRVATAVASAFGFLGVAGHGSVFAQAAKDDRDQVLHEMVVWCVRMTPKEWLAVETVAKETGLSESTVRRAFKRGVAEQWHVDELTEWKLKSI